jgi:16S rRNA (guanine1207-N2)-methyltransferase
VRCRLRGLEYEFLTSPGVFSYKRIDLGTRLLVESMVLPDEGRLLDVGCGYGVIGIVAASIRPKLRVFMTDVNERAVLLAKRTVERYGLVNVTVLEGDMYGSVEGELFDVVVSNPPFSAGWRRVVEPLVAGAVERLVVGGMFQVVVQSNTGGRALAGLLEEYFGGCEVLARGSGYRVLLARRG